MAMFERESFFHLLPPDTMEVCEENLNKFFETMFDRHLIWYKRYIEQAPREEWTKDEILRDYKFTNVYRELDRTSVWIIRNIIKSQEFDGFMEDREKRKNMLWKMLVARLINLPDTFSFKHSEHTTLNDFVAPDGRRLLFLDAEDMGNKGIPNLKEYDSDKMTQFLYGISSLGINPYSSAFFVKAAEGHNRYTSHVMSFGFIRDNIERLLRGVEESETPEELVKYLEEIPNVSWFMSHEFYQDLTYIARYRDGESFMRFDQNDYTNVGPGASVGIRLIFPSLPDRKRQKKVISELRDRAVSILNRISEERGVKFPYIGVKGGKIVPETSGITLHQIEMWLCEFGKYWKMKNKIGRQRSKYSPQSSKSQTMFVRDEDFIYPQSDRH